MNSRHVVGVVLAGGQGRRLRKDKCQQLIGGVPIINRVLAAVTEVVDETILVGDCPPPPESDLRLVPDERPGAGPLQAIHTGMKAVPTALYLVVACDMPFVTADLFQHLVAASHGFQAVVPHLVGRDQPLCAVYARSCLPTIEQVLKEDENARVAAFFPRINLRRVTEAELAALGPPELLFFNVNAPEDLQRAQRLDAQAHSSNSSAKP